MAMSLQYYRSVYYLKHFSDYLLSGVMEQNARNMERLRAGGAALHEETTNVCQGTQQKNNTTNAVTLGHP